MKDIDEAMHFADENGSFSSSFYFNDRAPLVKLQDICSAASIDANSDVSQQVEMKPKSKPAVLSDFQDSPLNRKVSQLDDTASTTSSQQTVINRPHPRQSIKPVPKASLHDLSASKDKKESESATQSTEEEKVEATIAASDPQVSLIVYFNALFLGCYVSRRRYYALSSNS
jgi:hypothetical protein